MAAAYIPRNREVRLLFLRGLGGAAPDDLAACYRQPAADNHCNRNECREPHQARASCTTGVSTSFDTVSWSFAIRSARGGWLTVMMSMTLREPLGSRPAR